jgi:hypothetical protein
MHATRRATTLRRGTDCRTTYMNLDPTCVVFSAVGKMREEANDVGNPIVHVGARPGWIRDDPDDDENYYYPGHDLPDQSSYLLCIAEYLCPQMPSYRGGRCRWPAGSHLGPGASIINLLTDRPNHCFCSSIAPPQWAGASTAPHRIFEQGGCQGDSPDCPPQSHTWSTEESPDTAMCNTSSSLLWVRPEQ